LTSSSHHEEDEEDDSEDKDDGNDDDDDDGPDRESSAVVVVEAFAKDGVGEGARAREGFLVLGFAVVLAAGVGGLRGSEAHVLVEARLEAEFLVRARHVVGVAHTESASGDG